MAPGDHHKVYVSFIVSLIATYMFYDFVDEFLPFPLFFAFVIFMMVYALGIRILEFM